jgi:hypothetical protein
MVSSGTWAGWWGAGGGGVHRMAGRAWVPPGASCRTVLCGLTRPQLGAGRLLGRAAQMSPPRPTAPSCSCCWRCGGRHLRNAGSAIPAAARIATVDANAGFCGWLAGPQCRWCSFQLLPWCFLLLDLLLPLAAVARATGGRCTTTSLPGSGSPSDGSDASSTCSCHGADVAELCDLTLEMPLATPPVPAPVVPAVAAWWTQLTTFWSALAWLICGRATRRR